MLIWYSQEARSYAVMVFFCAAGLYFFLRALRAQRGPTSRSGRFAPSLALGSHYFAVFAIAVEAAWMLVALRARMRTVLPAVAAVGIAGLALLPLLIAQVNPLHIDWIDHTPLSSRASARPASASSPVKPATSSRSRRASATR